MGLKRFSGWIAGVLILACSSAATAAPPAPKLRFADDLTVTARDAKKRDAVVMLVFTEASCPYCVRAKRDYLEPTQASRDYGSKVVMREVDVRRSDSLRDFAGAATTQAAFAKRYAIRVVPTVIVVDYTGKPLADPLVGLLTEDFYQLYVERAVDAGRLKLRGTR